MKKIVLPLVLLAMLGGQAQAQKPKTGKPVAKTTKSETSGPTSLAIGSSIPMEGAMLMNVKGTEVSLNQAKTPKGLLVMFSCNTCPFVIKAQQKTREALGIAKKLEIGVVIINSNQAQRHEEDSREKMLAYADQQGYEAPYVIDEMSEMANAFGATRTPEVFLFDGEGKLVYKGALEDNPAEPEKSTKHFLADAMKAMDQHAKISPAETKSIGCSIKRMPS